MKERTDALSTDDAGNLNKFPHVLSQMIDIIVGKAQASPGEKERRWRHLAECIYCQTFLASYLLETIADDKAHGLAEEPARGLLTRLTRIMHGTLKRDIPAYVETLVEQGIEETAGLFPLLTDHLRDCQDCQSAVQDLQSWLQEFE